MGAPQTPPIAADAIATATATAPGATGKAQAVLLFALTTFLSAFLLFQIQPIIGRYILPWFGGAPGVWTMCMLFFQVLLLAGYAYAHLSTRYLVPRTQAMLHLVLLIGALTLLPIIPTDTWKPLPGQDPTWRILALLSACIGLPYFVLSTTGPLLQGWFSRLNGGAVPYRLYALSNVGSLLALVSYPFVVEPHLSRGAQAAVWSIGLACFVLLCGACALRVWRQQRRQRDDARATADTAASDSVSRPGLIQRLLWLLLPACASVLLLATTNKLCQDVAVVPFLWVLPLGLYLISFILCFDSPRWYIRSIYGGALLVSLPLLCWLMLQIWPDCPHTTEIALYAMVLFLCCMLCHGELYRLRPPVRHLTSYYLTISAGGALGGLFVGIAAPRLFPEYLELHIGLWSCAVLVLLAWWTEKNGPLRHGQPAWAWIPLIACLVIFAATLWAQAQRLLNSQQTIWRNRNFYGVLSVRQTPAEAELPMSPWRQLMHGRIIHGIQPLNERYRNLPTSYFGPNSGVGMVLDQLRPAEGKRVGVLGLGAGTLAAWAQPDDYFRFYEINPAVEDVARGPFTYLAGCRGKTDVVIGDGRLMLESEPDQHFDVLILDAFSSDSIPMHLLTEEAFRTYLRHLKPGGVIAANMTNRVVDIEPVLAGLAQHFGLYATAVRDFGNIIEGNYPTLWMLMSADASISQRPGICTFGYQPEVRPDLSLWTDDRHNLFQILK